MKQVIKMVSVKYNFHRKLYRYIVEYQKSQRSFTMIQESIVWWGRR